MAEYCKWGGLCEGATSTSLGAVVYNNASKFPPLNVSLQHGEEFIGAGSTGNNVATSGFGRGE